MTNALAEYAPFDKEYPFAYWSKRLNRPPIRARALSYTYKKSVSLPYMDIQIGEISLEHLMFVERIRDPLEKACTLIAICVRFEGEEAPVKEIISMPMRFIGEVFDAMMS